MASVYPNCHHCMGSLCGRQYAMKEENAYCVRCYDSLFANICEECKKPIECHSKGLSYKGCHWHEACFKCAKCNQSLVEKPFAAKDDRLLCTECYSKEYSSKCFHCKRTIMPGSRKMEFKGNCWHEACFVCQHCRQPLGTKPLITKDNDNYCVPCFEKQFAQCCYSCKQVITTGGVTYRDQPWHKECFVCTGCQQQLAGQRFVSKDEHPYCLECFSRCYEKKCVACSKPITDVAIISQGCPMLPKCMVAIFCEKSIADFPLKTCLLPNELEMTAVSIGSIAALGGAKFISFEDRQWHSDCFNCGKCSSSLVGKGFLTQQDQILCCKCISSI